MPFSVDREAEPVRLELAGELTIRHAGALREAVAAIQPEAAIRVEAAAVHDADTSILQILCSLRRSARQFTCQPVSAGFEAAVDRCGLRRELLADAAAGRKDT